MRTTALHLSGALVATLLASGCATSTGAGGPDGSVKQADERLPSAASFYDASERSLVEEAHAHQAAARKLVDDGDPEKAHAEFATAADCYARFADTYGSARWRIAFRYRAAEDLLFAQQPDRAAAQADKILADPDASPRSKAMAAYLSALAWRNVAAQREKAGEIEPIRLATVDQRAGAPLAKRPPAEPWARFIAAVDALLPIWEQHPDAAKLFSQRNFALTAAQVLYACDDMAEAQRRLEAVISRWSDELEVMERAVPLLLQTFLVRGDDAGFGAVAEKMGRVVDAQLAKAGEADAKERLSKVREQVSRLRQQHDFAAAKRLLEGGKAADAAAAFERFAADHPAAVDAPAALFNAALAWDGAGQPEKASAARQALVEKYRDAVSAPVATLYLAGGASKRGDHAAAVGFYAAYLDRWPDAPDRCTALQNIGHELDVQDEKAGAAERYLAFGTDARCAKERPNEAAKALHRSGKLLFEADRKRAKAAFEAATRVPGVTDPAALRLMEDARRQIKKR